MKKANWPASLKTAKKAKDKSIYNFIQWRHLLTTGNTASYYEYKKSTPLITEMQVYYVDKKIVGKNISEELDIFCHLYLTKLVTEELSLI